MQRRAVEALEMQQMAAIIGDRNADIPAVLFASASEAAAIFCTSSRVSALRVIMFGFLSFLICR